MAKPAEYAAPTPAAGNAPLFATFASWPRRFDGGAAGATGAAGGGGGATGGTGTGGATGGTGAAGGKGISAEEFAGRLKKQEKKFQSELEALRKAQDDFQTKLMAQLAALQPAKPAAGGGGGGADDIANNPAFKGQQQKLQDLETKLEAERAEKAKLAQQARNGLLLDTVRKKLEAYGITGTRAEDAVDLLVKARGTIRYASDTDDEIVFGSGKNEVDLDSGLEKWAKSEHGRSFMPPAGARGSGDNSGGGNPRRKTEAISRDELANGFVSSVLRGGAASGRM